MIKYFKSKAGFTLIELMVVVAIIGILAAIAIPQFSAYREKGYIASMYSDCNSIRVAEEAHYVDNDAYTDILANLEGAGPLSTGNSVIFTSTSLFANDFTVTISSTKSGKSVVYDSVTGLTTLS